MKIPTVRLVFDRKKVATKTNKGLIQIEVLFNGKRKWMSTGIKVYSDQWDSRRWVVNSADMYDVNSNLREQVETLEKWLRDTFSIKEPFSWEKLDRYLKATSQSDDFIEFLAKTIDERNDIKGTTKKTHRKLITMLKEFGKIKYFSDLTRDKIMDFDNWLHGRKVRKLDKNGIESWVPMRQQSIFDYHKTMKIYINKAVQRGLLQINPYIGQRFKRGESEPDRYLTEDELHQLEDAPMRNGSMARSKDLFLFQCYSGLSYADLCEFDFSKAKETGGEYLYSGKRKKTGETYYFFILQKAMDILKKYDFKLPIISNEGYNQNLKKVAADAGLDKPLATHWARRTAAMIFANHGIRIEVVAKILGHSSVTTTERFYADITSSTVAKEMKKAGL